MSRKKLLKSPDEFLSLSVKVFGYLTDHKRQILLSGLILIILLFAGSGWLFYQKHMESKAQILLAQAYEFYKEDIHKNSIDKFQKIVDKYPNSQAAKYTILHLGNIYFNLRDYDRSITYYSILSNYNFKVDYLSSLVQNALGYCYLEKGDFAKSIDCFKKIIDKNEEILMEESYLNLGRCFEKINKKRDALDAYRKALLRYPDSPRKASIQYKISRLEESLT